MSYGRFLGSFALAAGVALSSHAAAAKPRVASPSFKIGQCVTVDREGDGGWSGKLTGIDGKDRDPYVEIEPFEHRVCHMPARKSQLRPCAEYTS